MFKAVEILYIILASLVTGFLLVWIPSKAVNYPAFWIAFLLSFAMFFIFIAAQKLIANSLDCETRIKLLGLRRYGLAPRDTLGFELPLWLILPIITFFIASGKFIWTAILNFEPVALKSHVRRKFSDLSEKDIAKIAVAGPLSILILGLIMRIVHFDSFAYLCVLTAFLSFLPLGNGIKIFAGMKHTGIFLLILSFAILLMLHLPAILATIIIAIVIALALMIAYYTLWER